MSKQKYYYQNVIGTTVKEDEGLIVIELECCHTIEEPYPLKRKPIRRNCQQCIEFDGWELDATCGA